jgi:flavin reductase (DIM6/NTAB) family NADH-FMN oxidoreductase RutF
MQHFSLDLIQSWERFYRGNFINTLSGFKSASLIASQSAEGNPNLAIFSNLVHIGADPALIGFINRPREASPHTLTNIEATGQYTINHIPSSFIAQAHQTSAKYPPDKSEFDAVGLQPLYRSSFPVPFVRESSVQYAMKLVEVIPIRHNQTFLVIGAVQEVWLEEGVLQPDGFIDLEAANSVTSLGLDSYYETKKIARFEYAKQDKPVRLIL